jgi:hypothetical protein
VRETDMSKNKGKGAVIFLDMDGVLSDNDDTGTLSARSRVRPECVRELERIVRATGAKVVVSST